MATRDSAGVRIVESAAPRWAPDEGWRVLSRPLLSLGGVDAARELSFTRIAGVHRLDDGRVVVVDGGSSEVRFYDGDGRFLRAFGGSGDGPGEFRAAPDSQLRADSLWLIDAALNRLTVLHTGSDTFRVVGLEAQNVALGFAGLPTDGSAVLVADLLYTLTPDDSVPPGPRRFPAAYLRVGPTGETLDTLFMSPGSERVLRYGAATMEVLRPLFGRSVSHAVADGRIFQGDQETYRIRAYELDGRPSLEIRRTQVDVTLTDAVYTAAMEARVSAAPDFARPGLRAMYESQPRPPTRGAYGRFLADPLGHLWVQDFSIAGDAPTWAVFAPDGAWLGTVTLPERFRATQILEDEVVGVWRDDLDVEHARVYRLEREG